MKKVLGTISAVVVLMACGSGEGKKEASEATETKAVAAAPKPLSENPDYQKGLALVAGSDCLTCHKTSEKLIGPAYKDVAAKYEATESNIKMLASKVLKGGTGVWGAIPMTPHPQIKEEDAEAMVKYVLLLKK
ncbi:MAG: c-type cytochrome [Chitinophagia bacterium]|jgi:cytochrome c